MKHLLATVTALHFFSIGIASAQTDAEVIAFNEAWAEYSETLQQSRTDLRVEAAKKVLDLGGAIFAESDKEYAILMRNYGAALFDSYRLEEATSVLRETLKFEERLYGTESTKLVPTLSLLANSEEGHIGIEEQLRRFQRALKLVAAAHGDDSREYADLQLKAGQDIYHHGRSAKGRRYLVDALEFYQENLGSQDINTGHAALGLAKISFSEKHFKKSIEYSTVALAAFYGDAPESLRMQLVTRALLVQSYEKRGETELATKHAVEIGRLSELRPNQERMPIFHVNPEYPREAQIEGDEGHVDFTVTIDEEGYVRDVKIVDRVTTGKSRSIFDLAATKALKNFRYAPKFVDGQPVREENLMVRISFVITD